MCGCFADGSPMSRFLTGTNLRVRRDLLSVYSISTRESSSSLRGCTFGESVFKIFPHLLASVESSRSVNILTSRWYLFLTSATSVSKTHIMLPFRSTSCSYFLVFSSSDLLCTKVVVVGVEFGSHAGSSFTKFSSGPGGGVEARGASIDIPLIARSIVFFEVFFRGLRSALVIFPSKRFSRLSLYNNRI